ncbi:hypothetical protein K493DRAFT_361751 [Basidiobolus meristosporus CBS 931.73]|uniref:Uncharacterized protein n=1 Tax=Basidiobolus meristosporus CBS 931.73 TaxID=1314790 RepID=A0A1Y1X724_9FUNG|nr:hypothetical protein K493DRAFT_361751 [Basidiobolus meristosporus CBS 931.73]|eukprot:ORX81567.1 hypothetical protein K493DRAFT_361751 [Basidiobolus meristosporus CBS 931.73]
MTVDELPQDSVVSEDWEEAEQESHDDDSMEDVEYDEDSDSSEESEWSSFTFTSAYSIWSISLPTLESTTPTSSTEPTPTRSSGLATASHTDTPSTASTNTEKGPMWNQPTKVKLHPETPAYGQGKKNLGTQQYSAGWRALAFCSALLVTSHSHPYVCVGANFQAFPVFTGAYFHPNITLHSCLKVDFLFVSLHLNANSGISSSIDTDTFAFLFTTNTQVQPKTNPYTEPEGSPFMQTSIRVVDGRRRSANEQCDQCEYNEAPGRLAEIVAAYLFEA